jgi:hypothetical protein
MNAPFSLTLAGAVIIYVAIIVVEGLHRHWVVRGFRFWYEVTKSVTVPIAGPLILAAVGFWFGSQLDRQRTADTDSQSKAAILREHMTTQNGPDVAFFTAIGDRLTVHLQRYKKHRAKGQASGNLPGYLDANAQFDEQAIYFFYGMFRVALVDFFATKGFVLYPRIWMEQAFEGLSNHVVEHFNDGKESELKSDPEEQAALYRYFGASKAMYHTTSSRDAESIPDLSQFHSLLEKEPQLKTGFANFQKRLRNGAIQPDEMIRTFEAIVGLDDYAFNTLFTKWYRQFGGEEPPTILPKKLMCDPPNAFLPYPLPNFEATNPQRKDDEWKDERKKAWTMILQNVPTSLKATPCS